MQKRKRVGDIFDVLDEASKRQSAIALNETKEAVERQSAIASNETEDREKFRTSVYLSLSVIQKLNQRRMELRQRGIRVRNNAIIEAAVEYVMEDLDRLSDILKGK